MNWKPNADEKRELRFHAAHTAQMPANTLRLMPGLRVPLDNHFGALPSFNDWAWGEDTETDLHDNGFTMKDFAHYGGAEMNEDGKALVDFYVYELGNWGHGIEPVELVCNIQAVIETVDGKPIMVRVLSGPR